MYSAKAVSASWPWKTSSLDLDLAWLGFGPLLDDDREDAVTGQLVSLKLSDLAMPAIILGVVGGMIARHSTACGAWRTILGFGLLFFGMNLMSHELKGISKLPEFIAFFSRFDSRATIPLFAGVGAGGGAEGARRHDPPRLDARRGRD